MFSLIIKNYLEKVLLEKSELKQLIIDIVKDNDIVINDDTILVGEHGLFFDSVDVLELIVSLENKFGIKIIDNDLINEKFRTFQSFYDFINGYKK